MGKARLDGLDGLRGIAALCVFLSHVFAQIDGNAYLAVDFFFMLSGYVMARSYEERLRGGGLPAVGAFMRARFVRLYPLVFLGSMLGIPWLLADIGEGAWMVAVAGLLFMPAMLNPPAWSIACELAANLFHGLLLARMPTRRLAMLCVVLLALLVFAARGRGLGFPPGPQNWVLVMVRTLVPYGMGVTLYRRWQDRPPIRIGAAFTWTAMPAFFVVSIVTGLANTPADFLFVAVLCPLLIAGGLQNGSGSRLAIAAGALSFPLYAVHGPVILTLQDLDVPRSWQVVIGLASGLAALWLSRRMSGILRARPVSAAVLQP